MGTENPGARTDQKIALLVLLNRPYYYIKDSVVEATEAVAEDP